MKAAAKGGRRRAYVYALVTTGIVLLFALAEWWVEKYISDHSRVASVTIEIAIVLVGTLVFRPIHERVEAAVEEAFTKRRREAREALTGLRKELTSFNDVGQILRRTATFCAFIQRSKSSGLNSPRNCKMPMVCPVASDAGKS